MVVDFSLVLAFLFAFIPLGTCSPKCQPDIVALHGIRVEGNVISYDSGINGECSVQCGVTKVRLFGCGLNYVSDVLFSASSFCPLSNETLQSTPHQIHASLHTDGVQSETLVVTAEFSEVGFTYYVCLGIRHDSVNITHYLPPETVGYALISTTAVIREYYLPWQLQICVVICLLMLSGLFSGLTLGLMSLDNTELRIILNAGAKQERIYASKIIPIRKSGNYLLCSLVFGNVIVNSGVSILFDDLTSGLVALVGSTIGIVIFGEVLPQAICNRYGLAVGAKTIWITRLFMIITFPLSYPVSKCLDFLLGEEVGTVYNKERLLELIRVSQEKNGDLKACQEVAIVSGALALSQKTVKDIMTQAVHVFMVPADGILDSKLISEIVKSGYTRIPVYGERRDDIVSILNMKDLALLDPDDKISVKMLCGFYQHPIRFVLEDMPLNAMLEEFKQGHYHMAFVRRIVELADVDPTYEFTGLVTLEDIIEEIIQSEILDETDVITDNRRRLRRKEAQVHDFSYFMQDAVAQISPQLAVAAYQYLSTSLQPFKSECIAEPVLQKLIKQNVALALPPEEDELPKFLYEKDKAAAHFVLILEGHVAVEIGTDNMMFQAGPFCKFGEQVLQQMHDVFQPTFKNPPLFVPDFSVRIVDKVVYLLITAKTYHDAMCSTLMRRGFVYSQLSTKLSPSRVDSPNGSAGSCNLKVLRQKSAEDVIRTISDFGMVRRNRSSVGYSNCSNSTTPPVDCTMAKELLRRSAEADAKRSSAAALSNTPEQHSSCDGDFPCITKPFLPVPNMDNEIGITVSVSDVSGDTSIVLGSPISLKSDPGISNGTAHKSDCDSPV